jgi:hypothetical protein
VAGVGRLLLTVVQVAVAVVAVALFGAGVPLFWVWLGSQLQGGTAPSLSGLGVTLLGIVVSYSLLAVGFAWLKERTAASERDRPVRHAWNRSLSAERYQPGRHTHAIEDVAVAATVIVGILCTAWFLLAGDPGVPVAP